MTQGGRKQSNLTNNNFLSTFAKHYQTKSRKLTEQTLQPFLKTFLYLTKNLFTKTTYFYQHFFSSNNSDNQILTNKHYNTLLSTFFKLQQPKPPDLNLTNITTHFYQHFFNFDKPNH